MVLISSIPYLLSAPRKSLKTTLLIGKKKGFLIRSKKVYSTTVQFLDLKFISPRSMITTRNVSWRRALILLGPWLTSYSRFQHFNSQQKVNIGRKVHTTQLLYCSDIYYLHVNLKVTFSKFSHYNHYIVTTTLLINASIYL